MAWRKVRLELARTPEFPEGSPAHGYEFIVPLDAAGHMDEEAWRQEKARATVRRFWQGAEDEHGLLIHTKGRRWAFSYAPGEEDDTPLFHLENHILRSGEYLSITEQDGDTLTFKITAIH